MVTTVPEPNPGRELATLLDDWADNGLTGVAYFRNGRAVASDLWEYVKGQPLIGIAETVTFFSADEIIAVSAEGESPWR